MNDLKPHKHADEGEGSTHAVCICTKHNIGGESICCECSRKTDCENVAPHENWEEEFDKKFTTNRNAHIGAPENEVRLHIISKKCEADVKSFIRSLLSSQKQELREKIEKLIDPNIKYDSSELTRRHINMGIEQALSLLSDKEDWRDTCKEWKCECGMRLPYWGAKMEDGNLRCQECKRVYNKPNQELLSDKEEKR